MVPVLVVEIVPARLLAMESGAPVLVVEIMPAFVVEIVPALVVEIVPVFAAAVIDKTTTNVAVEAMNFRFVIALAPRRLIVLRLVSAPSCICNCSTTGLQRSCH